jgi:mono/diheme cytochrome c family protein
MPALIDPSLVGSDVFRSFCAPCHGRDGAGGGPVASALKKTPADLTRIRIANGGQFPRRRIEEFVTNGKPGIVAHGSSDMPIWGPTFRSLEPSDALVKVRIANVVDYIESIQK